MSADRAAPSAPRWGTDLTGPPVGEVRGRTVPGRAYDPPAAALPPLRPAACFWLRLPPLPEPRLLLL